LLSLRIVRRQSRTLALPLIAPQFYVDVLSCQRINRSHTHTHAHTHTHREREREREREKERTKPPTPTHTHTTRTNTPNPQTNTSHKHFTALGTLETPPSFWVGFLGSRLKVPCSYEVSGKGRFALLVPEAVFHVWLGVFLERSRATAVS